jgi:arylsulfatase A-like enzyme
MLTPPAAGERDLTPNLRALAERGVVFSRAISQSPWTMPAFASILTGKYPMQHGAISLTGRLRNREVTLAEVLREANYVTGSFVSHDYTDAQHGFAQGNDEFSDKFSLGHEEITGHGITDQAIDFVSRQGGRPFFLFAHYFDPHYEYRNHPEWSYADGYSGWLADQLDFDNLVKNRQLLEEPEKQYLRDLYDEEVAYTDREIGRLVAALDERQLMARTVFILCADHGEEFLEHGNLGHTTSLYDELLHVPLVVVVPSMVEAHTVVARTVETRQIFSTVIEALGIDYGYNSRPRSLLAPANAGGGAKLEPQTAFSMLWLPDAKPAWGKKFKIVSLQTDQWKLIHDLTRGRYLLFDLDNDPHELRDLSDSDAPRLAKLRGALDAWLAEMQLADKDVPHVELDDETRSRLKKLGYM